MLNKLFTRSVVNEIVLEGVLFQIKHTLRKNMKRIILRMEKKNEISISSPRISKKHLLKFIDENKTWIFDQQTRLKDPLVQGSDFYYLGKTYVIKHHKQASTYLDDEHIYINPLKAKENTDSFYKKCAKSYLPQRVEFWQNKMGLQYNALGFRLAKKRWGSCNAKRNISLNPYMMKLSYEMIDYIIVHELSHLVHLNHSKAFYQTVKTYLPHYKKIESEIKTLSMQLN